MESLNCRYLHSVALWQLFSWVISCLVYKISALEEEKNLSGGPAGLKIGADLSNTSTLASLGVIQRNRSSRTAELSIEMRGVQQLSAN